MHITYYGHSCFSAEINGKHLLFDPFISPNPLASHIKVDEIKADYIFISHGHEDHIADVVSIAKRTGATCVCAYEIYVWLNKQGVTNVHPMNTGGRKDFGDFAAKCTVAQHSSSFPDGSYAGNPMGFVITSDDGNFYYSGDTALTLDMQLLSGYDLNVCLLPIGDNFTMSADEAAMAAEFVHCNKVIALHYDTFGFIKVDHKAAKESFEELNKELIFVQIGDTISI